MVFETKSNGLKMILMQRCFWVIYIWLFAEPHEALLSRNDERDQRAERQEGDSGLI